MFFILLILWLMMDFGGCMFDLDSRVHVASASVSTAPSRAVVALFFAVGASCCALAMVRSFSMSSASFCLWKVHRIVSTVAG